MYGQTVASTQFDHTGASPHAMEYNGVGDVYNPWCAPDVRTGPLPYKIWGGGVTSKPIVKWSYPDIF